MGDGGFGGWTRRRFGVGIGGVAAGLLGAGRDAPAKKRKKCKKPPRCPGGCTLLFSEPVAGQYCGTGSSFQRDGLNRCVPCTQNSDCTATGFPQCLTSVENLATGAVSGFQSACGAYTFGVCAVAHACRSERAGRDRAPGTGRAHAWGPAGRRRDGAWVEALMTWDGRAEA
jgi:hypothetical protein